MKHDINLNLKIHNKFEIEILDTKTNTIRQKAIGYNVICNGAWTGMISNANTCWGQYIVIGSGTGTPSVSDTALFHYIGGKQATNYVYSSDNINGLATVTRQIQLGISDYVGSTISEVGLASGTPGTLGTHAMLEDMNGNPISVTKTDTDIITIYATVYAHFDDTTGPYKYCNWQIDGIAASLFYRIAGGYQSGLSQYGGLAHMSIGKNGMSNSYKISSSASVANKSYTASIRIPVDGMNINGIGYIGFGAIRLSGMGDIWGHDDWAVFTTFNTPEVFETAINDESVGVGDGSKSTFRTKFDLPYDAVVKVNGVAKTSGVTVNKTPVSDSSLFMVPIYNSERFKHTTGSTGLSLSNNQVRWNMLHDAGIKVATMRAAYGVQASLYASNNLKDWVLIRTVTNTNTYTLTAEEGSYKYYKGGDYASDSQSITLSLPYSQDNIIFDTPPAVGDIITIDYTTPYIAKDTDHVLDINMSIQLGEYTPPNEGGDT